MCVRCADAEGARDEGDVMQRFTALFIESGVRAGRDFEIAGKMADMLRDTGASLALIPSSLIAQSSRLPSLLEWLLYGGQLEWPSGRRTLGY